MSRLDSRLDAHRAELAGCRRCARNAHVAPITSLAVAPRVMIVGQAPGQVEASGGRPFAGRAGKTLFRWLADAGIDEFTARRRIYIAAVTRCYPGPSPSGRGDRVPSVEEQDACAGWLERELAIIRPRVIIPIGKLAIARFLPNLPLDRLIGRAHESELPRRPLLIPLPHPSGASSWIHQKNHPELLRDAIALIATHVTPLLT
ncbi:MAG TPA: uracil-DNA glycosylase family protein [Gemmatimonadaceae bacterium]|nr:uracil-DNA glycosylase family protein [Gemmatimonadaceae bacterium]